MGGLISRRGDWRLERVGVALDTSADRMSVQGALPRWIANAWTQEHDLGISRHGFDDGKACLCCIYMPYGKSKDEHVLIAEELGIPDAHEQVKTLLETNDCVDGDFVARIATAMGVPFEPLATFVGQPVRSFYQRAICGGLIFQLSGGSRLGRTVVPMAFQSALAGIMLACRVGQACCRFARERDNEHPPEPLATVGIASQRSESKRCERPLHLCR
ncbi:hypothetical protein MPLB_1490086 [Mesorhizobium sp. ORS 3324]|nr:hypothetical protein MPLB_1490086 [Mesorhizobium sp. ORS 3324]